MATFMTNDYWAQKKGYTKFLADSGNGFVDKNDYPPATTLDLFREDAYAIIVGETNGVPAATHNNYLRNLEYRMVELMLDEEEGRETEEGRPQFIPRDYLFQRDRDRLAAIGSSSFNRGVGN